MDAIAEQGHTVSQLRTMSAAQLRETYGELPGVLVADRLKRKPIEDGILDALIAAADGCCCLCQDGNASRPYEIHHIIEYSESQDNSFDNLLVVCPTHHKCIHDNRTTTEEQRSVRAHWFAQVELALDYRARGQMYPYEAFVPLSYISTPSIAELLQFVCVSPSTSVLVCPGTVVDEALSTGTEGRLTVVQGRSGAGKSTVACAVAARLSQQGSRVYRHSRPPVGRDGLKEVMTFLACVTKPVVLILDDSNLYCTVDDLRQIHAAAGAHVHIVAVWTQEQRFEKNPAVLSVRSVTVTWEDIRPWLRRLLLQDEVAVLALLGKRESPDGRTLGFGSLSRSLESLIDEYSQHVGTVSEFLFLLSGGPGLVRPILRALADQDRADAPVLYAAAEQIAGFESAVEVADTAMFVRTLRSVPQQPEPTAVWVSEVFQAERRGRRMVERRGKFTTVHRDWARALLIGGLSDERIRKTASEIISRDFDVTTCDVSRLPRMWSWLWSDGHGARFVRDWASALRVDDWAELLRRSTTAQWEALGFLAGRMHLLFNRNGWDATVAEAMRLNEPALGECLRRAGPEDWYSVSELFKAVDYAAPELADRLRISWSADRVANLLNDTPIERYGRARWALSKAMERMPEWCGAICAGIDWNRIAAQLTRGSAGDLEAICDAWGVLDRLGFPLRRSMLRTFVDAMCASIASAGPQDLHFDGLNELSMVLWMYPAEVDRIFASLDESRWSADIAVSHPRHWRQLIGLVGLRRVRKPHEGWRLLSRVDPITLATSVSTYGMHAPYELRCFIWLLTEANQDVRERFAEAIEQTVEKVLRSSERERDEIGRAYGTLAPARAAAVFGRLQEAGIIVASIAAASDEATEGLELAAKTLADRDATGEDYVVREAL